MTIWEYVFHAFSNYLSEIPDTPCVTEEKLGKLAELYQNLISFKLIGMQYLAK